MAVLALLLVACSGEKKRDDHAKPDPIVGQLVVGDAGVTAVVTGVDPSGMHMDEGVAARPMQVQPAAREGKPIDVTLRSTPPGATVAVDGTVIGTTPAFWSGTADGREHEFVFTMRGHAIARYRFVPVASGVIHGRLDRIHEETDAGVPAAPPEVVPPKPPASAINPPTAPPTIVQPGDAAAALPSTVTPPQAPVTVPSGSSAPVGPQP